MHTKEAGASVSATTLYPFLSPPTRLARYYRKRRSSASNDRCNSHKRLVSKKTKKSSNQREIPFLDPFRCPLDLPRFVTRCTAIAFSLLARLADLSPSPPRNLFPDSQRAAITQLRASPPSFCSLFPPPLTILTLFSPLPWIDAPLSLSRACLSSLAVPVPLLLLLPDCFESTTCTTPRRFRRARPALSTGPIIFIANRLIRPLHFRVISFTWKLVHVNPTRSWRHRPPCSLFPSPSHYLAP